MNQASWYFRGELLTSKFRPSVLVEHDYCLSKLAVLRVKGICMEVMHGWQRWYLERMVAEEGALIASSLLFSRPRRSAVE